MDRPKKLSIGVAFFATLVQCYDYALFGLSAGMLSGHFLSGSTEESRLAQFFALFSIAVAAKPLGALIFGYIGDKYGRSVSVKIASATAALSTLAIGLSPSFGEIGLWASLVLTICRMCFIMSVAGEVDATRIYVAETVGAGYRNFANGLVSLFSQAGAAIASVSYYYAVSPGSHYSWKTNFLFGGSCGLIVIFLRRFFTESTEFLKFKSGPEYKKIMEKSLYISIKENKEKFFLAFLVSGSAGGIYHFLIIFFGTFCSKMACLAEPASAQNLTTFSIVAYAVAAPISGFLADRIGPRVQIFCALAASLFIIFLSSLVLKDEKAYLYFAVILSGLIPFYTIPIQIIVQSIFSVGVRMRMYSLAHSLGGMVLSGSSPLLGTLIWRKTGSVFLVGLLPAVFLFFILLCVIYLKKSKKL